jgi:hypothetical protein
MDRHPFKRRLFGTGLLALALAACATRRPAERWLLSYDGSWQRSSTVDAYRRALAGPVGNECSGGLFSGVIYLGLRETGSGRWFAAWMNDERSNDATFADWTGYLDTLTAPAGPLSRLDAAAGGVSTGKLAVAVMLPAIARGRTTLGIGAGSRLAVTHADWQRLYGEYIDTLQARFARRRYSHLDLAGVYWLDEAVWSSAGGGEDAPSSAIAAAHARGLKVLWIPYYGAGSAQRWRELGFDAAWQQPNFFFDATLKAARLDTAVARADSAGMGLELELDRRVMSDSGARRRLRQSVAALKRARNRDLAVYDGAGALAELFTSSDPALRETAAAVESLLCQR